MRSDWIKTYLGNEIELLYGKGLPKSNRLEGEYPVFGSNGIVGFHNEALVNGPGIIVGRKGSCGAVHFSTSDFWPIDTTYYISLRKGHDWRFVGFLLSTFRLSEMNSHSTIPGLNREDVYKLECHIPPLPQQQKIAAILFKIQQAIEIQESIIERMQELKKATMQHVFTYGLRGEKTKETEIGKIPESWEVEQIGSYCRKPEYGLTESAVTENVGPRFLRITDITENGVRWDTVPYCRCPDEMYSKYELKDNDILFARIGATTGKSFIVKSPPRAVFASYLIRLRTLEDVVPDYLFYFFNSEDYWNQINSNKKNNLKGGINSSILTKMLFPLPPKDEQIDIAYVLHAIGQKIELHTGKKFALQDIFKTMLNKLMSGEIRVKDLDVDLSEIK